MLIQQREILSVFLCNYVSRGEEFVFILPNTNASGAIFITHKIGRQLASQQILHGKSEVNDFVTFSIGVTTKIPMPKQPGSTIIEVADSLLYRAK